MSAPRPTEEKYLEPAEAALADAVSTIEEKERFELRLQVLEAVSARFGGFDLASFHDAFDISGPRPASELLELAGPVATAIESCPIQPALALSALSREPLIELNRKNTGAYHTDFRLATRLAELAATDISYRSNVIDPASGAGILLAALTHAVCGMDRAKSTYWLANGVCAADLSSKSLRATLLSLASFTDDISALKKMRSRWYCGDSLTANDQTWVDMAPDGFDVVIGNPPWEKLKLSRHEFLKSLGAQRHYGAVIDELDNELYAEQRGAVASYSQQLLGRYASLASGEPDLYIAFTELFFELCREQGTVAALFPGGLIRSQGTQAIRQEIIKTSQSISLSIIDNRAKFFAIDTRYKFLAAVFVKAGSKTRKREPIRLLHERGTPAALEETGSARIGRAALAAVRSDLSVPEVRNAAEWRLFTRVALSGDGGKGWNTEWAPRFCREVDMSKKRSKFLTHASRGALPLVEGRMVQAHRFGAKGYASGTGRSARWKSYAVGDSRVSPQFWIYASNINSSNQARIEVPRIGFCDIAGQTNERSLMAALIPPGVVCGNKVPTMTFPEDPSEERLLVWVAIANSFVFDWMLRRVLTTTVNYFILQSVPLPELTKGGLPWRRLANAARQLQSLDRAGGTREVYEHIADLRSSIDAEVVVAYGLDLVDMELMLQDFPLLDRGQKALPGEIKSTITRDRVLAAVAARTRSQNSIWAQRVERAQAVGAIGYVSSETPPYELNKDKGKQRHG